MNRHHAQRSPDEFYIDSLVSVIKDERTQKNWEKLVTIDPMGMFSTRPTMSACAARMMIPELQELEADEKIVNADDKSINCIKLAVDYAWNIPGVAQRLCMEESDVRKALAEYTQNDNILDTKINTYLPPVGGITVYFIGDPEKLKDPATEIAVRCHDECSGSDVFGTDICTCRPYLVYAIQGCVETAKRGGVGIIAYFRKEGRSLGEVTKFRVYNARKAQAGGDTAENYFKQTESIAGIRDARFQELMPEVLVWLGITRIDWLLSMSSDKYEGITGAGIEVMQRVALPDIYVPKGATVEITAKIAAGYHTENIASESILSDLRTLDAVRDRCRQVYKLAQTDKSKHFTLNEQKLDECSDYVINVMKNTYGDMSKIPYHSRWRHFKEKDVTAMYVQWPCDPLEKARRLLDLVTVSVLLDAGAGAQWHYIDAEGLRQERSEGLAIATLDMFKEGLFSSDAAMPYRVNSLGLKTLTLKSLQKGFQITESNPMVGLEGRHGLLRRLSKALKEHPEYFGEEVHRPGNIVDYLIKNANQEDRTISIRSLWKAVIEGFESIWPENHSGVRRGDVWAYSPLKKIGEPASDMVPFHKLSQWMTYSLLEPIEQLGYRFVDMDLLTGLAEYRNGGLMVDSGVLTPKREDATLKEHDVGSELVVEWRALTLICVDELAVRIRSKLGLTADELPLAKVLQGGTWSAGRLIAQEKRGNRSSPIIVRSDGTVF